MRRSEYHSGDCAGARDAAWRSVAPSERGYASHLSLGNAVKTKCKLCRAKVGVLSGSAIKKKHRRFALRARRCLWVRTATSMPGSERVEREREQTSPDRLARSKTRNKSPCSIGFHCVFLFSRKNRGNLIISDLSAPRTLADIPAG